MRMQVFKSRHTPGVKGYEVFFEKGEVVKYKLLNGKIIDITVVSERMKHQQCATFGYEWYDNGELCFADGERIIDWKGRIS